MEKELLPVGVVLQRVDRISPYLPKTYLYEGLMAYSDTPFDGFEKSEEAKALQMEFYDWLICQKEDGTYGMTPEAFYTPVFMRRFIDRCLKYNFQIKCLFIEYDGDERFWKFEYPRGRFMGYEVCDAPRSPDLCRCLDRVEYAEHRSKLNSLGIFKTYEDALAYKEAYEKEYYSGTSPFARPVAPTLNLNVYRLTRVEFFPDYVPR